jgi:hypothetical protein
MKKSITISIPEPCHEDWTKMTPTEKGKFCDVCTKEVFDFTTSNDEELIKRLEAGKSLCGRFKSSQLDREVKLERKSGNSLLPYAASLLLPLSILSTSETIAQEGPNITENSYSTLGIGSNPIKSIVTVTGMITNESDIPVANAEVFVLETGKSVRTQPDGTYKIVCTSGSTLFSTKEGRTSQQVVLGTRDAIIDMQLQEIKIPITVCMTETTIVTAGDIAVEIIEIEPVDEETLEGEIVVDQPENERLPEINNEAINNSEANEIATLLQGKVGLFIVDESTRPDDVLQVLISGVVSDLRGPIPGVQVQVKGTEIKTQTDFDGIYKIGVQPNTALIFSSLGYVSKEILVSNISNAINIQLEEDVQGDIEVMVLGRMQMVPVKSKGTIKVHSNKKKK